MPAQLSDAVPGAELPDFSDRASLQVGFDAQTGQLDKANAYKSASLDIVKRCEARDRGLDKALTKKPWWRLS